MKLEINKEQKVIVLKSLELLKSLRKGDLEGLKKLLISVNSYEKKAQKISNTSSTIKRLENILFDFSKELYPVCDIENIIYNIENKKDLTEIDSTVCLSAVDLYLRVSLGQLYFLTTDFISFSNKKILDLDIHDLNNILIQLKKECLPSLDYYQSYGVYSKEIPNEIFELYIVYSLLKYNKKIER